MHPRSRYRIYLAYCAVTCTFHLNVTLSSLNIEEQLLTIFHTLYRFDTISFERLLRTRSRRFY